MEIIALLVIICLVGVYLSFFNKIMDFVGEIFDAPFERITNFFYRCHEHQ